MPKYNDFELDLQKNNDYQINNNIKDELVDEWVCAMTTSCRPNH